MSKEVKSKKVNMAKLHIIGLWTLVIGATLFWGGVYVGSKAALNLQNKEAQVKTQAIEEYKATLKESK